MPGHAEALTVIFVCALLLLNVRVALPFLSALLWATVLVISTWPVLLRLQRRLGGRRGFATTPMTVVLLLTLLVPLSLAIGALMGNMDAIVAKVTALETLQVRPPPDWVAHIPGYGASLAAEWRRAAAEGPGGLATTLAPYTRLALRWLGSSVGGIGGLIVQFLLTVIIAAILYMNGETAARLAGVHGDTAALLAASTIRAVATGVVITAIVQTTIAGAGLLIASIPAAGLIVAIVFMFCLAQIGPLPAMIPVLIWKFHSGDTLGGFVLLAFGLVAGTMDNVIRPLLIRKGADLPLVLVFAGVIGGLIGFGVMGIFIGPVIFAVTFVLLREWVNLQPESANNRAMAAWPKTTPR